jgi:pyruvate dehydrogenase E1 component alpha subunit
MEVDYWQLYRLMYYSRLYEEAVARLWHIGEISGEMHLGIGEEAIVAGVVGQMRDGDALALDHRGTSPLLMRGVDPVALLRELLGRAGGICSGMGGHMHLFAPELLAASSGIVGASAPAGAGFALAAQTLRPDTLAVSFFGDGATNQGMLLETFNLAAVWKLPLVFVCKDDQWALLTNTSGAFGADLAKRARGFGIPAIAVDGLDVHAVWRAAGVAFERARGGDGPTFIHARCVHLEGHFSGDPFLRFRRQPLAVARQHTGPLLKALLTSGGLSIRARLAGLIRMVDLIVRANRQRAAETGDPLWLTRRRLVGQAGRLAKLEAQVAADVGYVVELAVAPYKTA